MILLGYYLNTLIDGDGYTRHPGVGQNHH